jgi:hypothetical protein
MIVRADEGSNFIDLADHLRLAFGRDILITHFASLLIKEKALQ